MQRLQMCLYLIELEYHFEGDGVWREPFTDVTTTLPVVGETEFDMLGDYRKTMGSILRADRSARVDNDDVSIGGHERIPFGNDTIIDVRGVVAKEKTLAERKSTAVSHV